jgi:hypothetical protein
VIAILENRRMLYEPSEVEKHSHCVHSVLEIPHRLSDELGNVDGSNSELAESLRAMRAACRKFLERVGTNGRDGIHHPNWGFHSWTFGSALGKLRGTFGIHVAKIAATSKLDVEDRLASIPPANADADTGDDDRLFRKLCL